MKRDIILSIDGGGIRGLIVAVILDWLQERLPLPLSYYIHTAAGTSTGGILAALIRAEERNFTGWYVTHGPVIFSKKKNFTWLRVAASKIGLVGYKYGSAYLHSKLKEATKDLRLSEVDGLILVAQSPRTKKAWIMTSEKAKQDPDYNFLIGDACLATAAAPSYFRAARIKSMAGNEYALVDGGLVAPNPGLVALREYIELHPDCTLLPQIISFGTGPDTEGSDFDGKPALAAVADIIDAQMAGASEVAEAINSTVYKFFHRLDIYTRINPDVTKVGMDDASPEAIKTMLTAGKKCIQDNILTLERIVEVLKSNQAVEA